MRHCPLNPIGLCFLLASQFVLSLSLSRVIRSSPKQVELVASPGDSVTLECEIRNDSTTDSSSSSSSTIPSNGALNIRWLLNGELLSLPEEEEAPLGDFGRRRPLFNATHGIHVLHISHALIQDDGVWHCQGVPLDHESLTFTSQPIRLIVAVAPETPYIVFEDRRLADGATFTIREKNTVTFSCIIQATNPAPTRVDWLLGNGINLTSQSHLAEEYSQSERLYHSKSDVTFEVTRKHHQVALHCFVHHLAHVKSVAATLSFNILYTPSFVISRIPGFGFPIREGIAVSLRCEVDANPQSEPTWVKDDGSPPTDIDSGEGFLNFSSITREHAGWYRCSTQHEFGHFASFGYFLNVRHACKPTSNEERSKEASPPCPLQYAPEVADPQPPPQIQVGVGGTVMLECASEGNPTTASSYCWARVKDGGRLESMATEHNLLFDRVVYTDAGVYKCISRNDVERERENRLPIKDVEVVVTGKPQVEPVNRTLMAIVGRSVSISVQYCANPKPSRAHWIIQSIVLKPGEVNGRFVARNLTNVHGSYCFLAILDILEVDEDDGGEFLFLVKNIYGIEDGLVWLNITQASFSVSLGITISQASLLILLSLILVFANIMDGNKR